MMSLFNPADVLGLFLPSVVWLEQSRVNGGRVIVGVDLFFALSFIAIGAAVQVTHGHYHRWPLPPAHEHHHHDAF
jgi:hypothetical protein